MTSLMTPLNDQFFTPAFQRYMRHMLMSTTPHDASFSFVLNLFQEFAV